MSDYLMREFRAHLTTSMDAVLRRAVYEIMLIFENSLLGHQMELRQKGEEIAQLIIKLQKAELKLKEGEFGVNRGVELNKTQMPETQREPVDSPQQTSDVPEIDFEVPDDWCVPLGCETINKQDYTESPSVRQVVNHDIDSHPQRKVLRRSKRGCTLNKRKKQKQVRISSVGAKRNLRTPMRNNMNKLPQDMKQEQTVGMAPQKRRRIRKEESENAATQSKKETVTNDSERRYNFRLGRKVCDTEVGLSVRARSHNRCRGCKKVFPFPSSLRYHTTYCKNLTAKETLSNLQNQKSCEEEKLTLPSLKQVSLHKEIAQSPSNQDESSRQQDEHIRKYSCEQCNLSFHKHCKLKEHFRVHTGEKPYPCSMCPKTFRLSYARKQHIMRIHKNVSYSSEVNGHLAWTKPLEETGDDHKNLISHKKDKSQATKHNVQRYRSTTTSPRARWQSLGTRCSNGYKCSLCQKVLKNKYVLIEHFRIHTGEKPLVCDKCPAAFRTRGQLSVHKKKGCNPKTVTKCAKGEEKYSAQVKDNKHMIKCHKEWPIHCEVCGKGFFLKGRLSNHMERLHKSASES